MELQLYIANLGKYNEGFLVGEWFTLPVNFEEVAEQIGLNEAYEEYAIHDYEAPFKISEYASLESLNDIANRMASLSDQEGKGLGEIIDMGYEIEEALTILEDSIFYYDCKTMSDVAYEICEETNMLEGMPERLQCYFDYEAFGRDLAIEGTFIEIEYGTWLEVRF